MSVIQQALRLFQDHYQGRLKTVEHRIDQREKIHEYHYFDSPLLRPGNGPRLLSHGEPTDDVIVFTHGLSDSPFYMESVARRFYERGCNVVMPLLPAHGLKDPDEAMEDRLLDRKWKKTIDNAVETALLLKKPGGRLSLGGFSTGGALSLNKVLRDRDHQVNGGLFLFSGALEIGDITETVGRLSFIQSITRITDGKVRGQGPNPYKYPELPNFAGLELIQIINENNRQLAKRKVALPVFAAHSVHDTTARLEGIVHFMKEHAERGVTVIIAHDVPHANLPLEAPIELGELLHPDDEPEHPPHANPQFEWMMTGALYFFERELRGGGTL